MTADLQAERAQLANLSLKHPALKLLAIMTETENPLQVRTFDHVTLIVADVEATRNFYVGLLGMEEKPLSTELGLKSTPFRFTQPLPVVLLEWRVGAIEK